MVKLTADEPVADSTDVGDPLGRHCRRNRKPMRLTVPASLAKVRLEGNIDWSFGGTGYRHVWIHQNDGLFFGAAKKSDEGEAGVQGIGSAVVGVIAGDHFDLIARQTSGSTKNLAADEPTWFAIEVVQ